MPFSPQVDNTASLKKYLRNSGWCHRVTKVETLRRDVYISLRQCLREIVHRVADASQHQSFCSPVPEKDISPSPSLLKNVCTTIAG
ncbi:hypothetical protein MRX96_017980 [Rhipicephalus microplus]